MELTLSNHRVEGLTDAIFAIVMTLIVLELKVPELDRHAANSEIVERLKELRPHLFAFFLTFALSALFWFLHHSSMQFIRHMTRPLILINLVFMMFVSLLPFSAALLGRFFNAPIALQIYYLHQFALGLLLAIQWEYVRRRDLTTENLTAFERVRLPLRLWTIPAACVAAFAISFAEPKSAQYAFILTALAGRAVIRFKERRA
jgi:uncharacterized membrane protein